VLITVVTVCFITVPVLEKGKEGNVNSTINSLKTTLNNSHNAIKNIWLQGYFKDAKTWASDPEFLNNTAVLLQAPEIGNALAQVIAKEEIRAYFGGRLAHHGDFNFFVISPDFKNLVSSRDEDLGMVDLMLDEDTNALEKVFHGYNQFIHPFISNVELPDRNGNLVHDYPIMFIAIPIKDAHENIIAALSLRLDPFDDFSAIMKASRIGVSGETYLVNKEGILISDSRFLDQLNGAGILDNKKHSMLQVEVRDPGVNLLTSFTEDQSNKELPYTYSLEQVLKGTSGFSKKAYRDYRGVLVYGTWFWDEELDLGFIAEMDKNEALIIFNQSRFAIISLVIIPILIILLIVFLSWKCEHRDSEIIKDKERYFNTVLNNAVNGTIIINEEGSIEVFNKKAQDIFGFKTDDVFGKNIAMLIDGFKRKHQDEFLKNHVKTRNSEIVNFKSEMVGIRKDGTFFPLSFGVGEIKLRERAVFMCIVTDLTEEQEASTALHDLKEKLHLSFDQAPIAISIISPDLTFSKINQAFQDLFGYSGAELQALTFKALTHPDDIDKSIAFVKKIRELNGEGMILEKRYLKKNGELIWGKIKIAKLKDTSGNEKGYTVMIEDISAQKEVEENLVKRTKELERSNVTLEKYKSAALSIMQDARIQKEQTENILSQLKVSSEELKKLNHAIEQSFATIVITDRIGKIEYANKAFTTATGYRLDEVMGKTLYLLEYNIHTSAFYENIWQSILDGKTWRGDVIHRKKTGEEYWESVSISPIHNDTGDITHFVAVKEDITERKKMEDKLMKSKIKADRANQAKSNFLANMSHEIRTPMNAILGFSDILSRRIKKPSHLEYLDSIQSSGKTLLTLINDILDLSKIESGEFSINKKPTHIKLLAQEVINMLTGKALEKGIAVNLVIADNFPEILVIDELRITQVLINLLSNAIKFTDQGFVEIEVTAQNTTADHLDLVLKIKDSGIGISKINQSDIFKAFNQIDMLDNKKYEGTGLGLTITRQLIKLMKGTIALKSTKGKGSLFTVVLKNVEISGDEVTFEKEIEFDEVSVQFEKSTVLIVDDNKNNLDLLKEFVKHNNINIIEAKDGKEALETLSKHQPNIIFLDLRMPVMDGFEANEAIKKNPDWSHIPVIAVTSSVYGNDKAKALSKGFTGYLEKPVSRKMILDILIKHVKHTTVSKEIEGVDEVVNEPIEQLDELILAIENKVMPIYEDIQKIRQKKTVLFLADQLIEIGEKYKSTSVTHYGEELQAACKSFNIPKERKLIKQLPFYINNLNTLHDEK
jgi:PAS domain S-box-containing protein